MSLDAVRANMPLAFDIISDDNAHTIGGDYDYYTSIMIWSSDVEFDTAGMKLNGNTIDLSSLEDDMVHGDVIPGKWTQIQLDAGIILAFKR